MKLCICSRSATFPLCDGTHETQGWSCAGQVPSSALTVWATRALENLGEKLAHDHNAARWRAGEQVNTDRLIALVDPSSIEDWRITHSSINAKEVTLIGVDLPRAALENLEYRWASPTRVELLEPLTSENPVALYASARAMLATPQNPSPQHPSDEPTEHAARETSHAVFVSHAVADEGALAPSIDTVRALLGVEVFVCADSISAGEDWHAAITRALRECDVFLFIASRASLESRFCAFEAGMALGLEKELRIVALDESTPPAYFQHLNAPSVPRFMASRPWLTSSECLTALVLDALTGTNET